MNILDSEIHDLQMKISRLQDKKRMLTDCERDLNNYGLEGMDFYHMSEEFEYMNDTKNIYFDIFKKSYSKGW